MTKIIKVGWQSYCSKKGVLKTFLSHNIGLTLQEIVQNVALCFLLSKVDEINALQERFKVRITVEKGQRINRIRIQGPPAEVTQALEQIHLVFQQVTKNDLEKFIAGQVTFLCSCSL